MRRLLWIPWRWWRRAAQLALLRFLWLFRRTEYTNADQLAGGENLFFRLDPLAGAAAMIAARQLISLFWPALVVVAIDADFRPVLLRVGLPAGNPVRLFPPDRDSRSSLPLEEG